MSEERRSQSIAVSAKTVAEAIAEAEQRLGLPREDIDVTVISEGSKGFLGMGGENARILAMPKAFLARRAPASPRGAAQPLDGLDAQTPEPPGAAPASTPAAPKARRVATPSAPRTVASPPVTTPAPPVDVPAAPAPPAEEAPPVAASVTPGPRTRRSRSVAPVAPPVAQPTVLERVPSDEEAGPLDELGEADEEDEQQPQAVRIDPVRVAEVAVEVVRELIVRMGLDAQATVRSTGNPVVIDIMGEDLGLLIGRHGDTLSSLQYLVNAIVGKRVHRWCKVIVDVEHYRMRREETLRALATRQASRVRQSRREIALDPMPAAERRVIHMTLQNSPWVMTHSVGEEPNRRVVIAPRQANR